MSKHALKQTLEHSAALVKVGSLRPFAAQCIKGRFGQDTDVVTSGGKWSYAAVYTKSCLRNWAALKYFTATPRAFHAVRLLTLHLIQTEQSSQNYLR